MLACGLDQKTPNVWIRLEKPDLPPGRFHSHARQKRLHPFARNPAARDLFPIRDCRKQVRGIHFGQTDRSNKYVALTSG